MGPGYSFSTPYEYRDMTFFLLPVWIRGGKEKGTLEIKNSQDLEDLEDVEKFGRLARFICNVQSTYVENVARKVRIELDLACVAIVCHWAVSVDMSDYALCLCFQVSNIGMRSITDNTCLTIIMTPVYSMTYTKRTFPRIYRSGQ